MINKIRYKENNDKKKCLIAICSFRYLGFPYYRTSKGIYFCGINDYCMGCYRTYFWF